MANEAKAAEEAEAKEAEEEVAKKRAIRKAARKKAALEEAASKDLLEGGPLTKGPLECPSEKGPLQIQRKPIASSRKFLEEKSTTATLFEQMERTLATISTSTFALRRKFENLERDWIEFESQYLEVHAHEEDALNDKKPCRFRTCIDLFDCNHLDPLDEELPTYGPGWDDTEPKDLDVVN